jgi:hypothetical protein
MILFYRKSDGVIFGTVNGRLHDPKEVERMMIKPSNTEESDIGKFIVPYKRLESGEFVPDVEFYETILEFEAGIKKPTRHKLIFDKGEISGIVTNE